MTSFRIRLSLSKNIVISLRRVDVDALVRNARKNEKDGEGKKKKETQFFDNQQGMRRR